MIENTQILLTLPSFHNWYYSRMGFSVSETMLNPWFGLVFIGLVFMAMVVNFFMVKITIKNIKYEEVSLEFTGTFPDYLAKITLGYFLSLITLTIYTPWFVRDITRFIVNNSSIETNNFQFLGKGSRLFLIVLLSLFIPVVAITLILGKNIVLIHENTLYYILYQGGMLIVSIPYLYLTYHWFVNLRYKKHHIKWDTKFLHACGKTLLETFLILVTAGIYMPMAYLKLYKYFAKRTVAEREDMIFRFGYEGNLVNDFLFLWSQALLSIFTMGIYFPWAFSNIGQRLASGTFITKH